MNDDSAPGLDRQSTVRTVARVLAVVLLLGGLVMVVLGLNAFAASMDSMDSVGPMGDPLAPSSFEAGMTFLAGGLCMVVGLVAANVGWLRAGATYAAGETMPVVKESLAYVTAGPHCRQCGTRNDGDATFCDSCGQSLA